MVETEYDFDGGVRSLLQGSSHEDKTTINTTHHELTRNTYNEGEMTFGRMLKENNGQVSCGFIQIISML